MSVEIQRLTELKLPKEQRDRLFEWDKDVFSIGHLKLTWAPKDIHFILEEDGQAATHVGVLTREVTVDGHPIRIGGIGGVITALEAHGKGYASQTIEAALAFMQEEWQIEFGMLFCIDKMLPFYQNRGWQKIIDSVIFQQPEGSRESPLNVMVWPCQEKVWPAGPVDMCGLPW